MKKFLILLIIFVFFYLSACNASQLPKNTDMETKGTIIQCSDETFYEDVFPNNLYFTDVESYNDYLAETNLPKNFVTAEALKCIGSFYGFLGQSDFHNYDYSEYYYILTDANQKNIGFYIDHTQDEPLTSTNILTITDGMKDMRFLDTDQSGIIVRNGVTYQYRQGWLISIKWYQKGIEFTIGFNYDEVVAPLGKNESFLNQLFSLSDVSLTNVMKVFESALQESLGK